MGPIALFDKSFLQSLNVDESVWFDKFYMPVVCPIFFAETLANLAKDFKDKPAEKAVHELAEKFPEFGAKPVIHHLTLCQSNLLGREIPLDGRVVVPGGKRVSHQGKIGVTYDESPEAIAFGRWREEKFEQLERDFAKQWRESLAPLDLGEMAKSFKVVGMEARKYASTKELKDVIDELVNSEKHKFEMMRLAISIFNIADRDKRYIFERWTYVGQPPIAKYASYAAFALGIEIFFQLAIQSNLIAATRNSHRMDIAYLFYLPFCMTFISSDKLHKTLSPLFMRNDQSFIWGISLKQDLKKINDHYLQLPIETREKGISYFAQNPPTVFPNAVADSWDRFSPNWRSNPQSEMREPESNEKLLEYLKGFTEAPVNSNDMQGLDMKDVDTMSFKYMVRKKKGSWYQVPKDIKHKE